MSIKHALPAQVYWQSDDQPKELNFFSISSDGRVASWVMSKNELKMEPVMQLKLVNTIKVGGYDGGRHGFVAHMGSLICSFQRCFPGLSIHYPVRAPKARFVVLSPEAVSVAEGVERFSSLKIGMQRRLFVTPCTSSDKYSSLSRNSRKTIAGPVGSP